MDINPQRIDGTQTLTGTRDARTIFSSIKILKEVLRKGGISVAPYGNIEGALIGLSGFTETGGSQALVYHRQVIRQGMLKAGVDASYSTNITYGKLIPFTRLEYAHDFSPRTTSDVHYVGNATNYRVATNKNAEVNWSARLGADYTHKSGASSSLHYEYGESISRAHSKALYLKISIPL